MRHLINSYLAFCCSNIGGEGGLEKDSSETLLRGRITNQLVNAHANKDAVVMYI
jgi:hypothetical protein